MPFKKLAVRALSDLWEDVQCFNSISESSWEMHEQKFPWWSDTAEIVDSKNIFQLTSAVSDYHEKFLFIYISEDDSKTVVFNFLKLSLLGPERMLESWLSEVLNKGTWKGMNCQFLHYTRTIRYYWGKTCSGKPYVRSTEREGLKTRLRLVPEKKPWVFGGNRNQDRGNGIQSSIPSTEGPRNYYLKCKFKSSNIVNLRVWYPWTIWQLEVFRKMNNILWQ